jgi:hypothetical protein
MIQLALAMLVHRKAGAGFTVLGLAALFPLSGAPRRTADLSMTGPIRG